MPIFFWLLLIFVLVPLAELAILVWLTSETGLILTVSIVLATGFIGAAIAKWQGLRAWRAIRAELTSGRVPAATMVDGVLILLAGTLLLAPGLLPDATGLLLLIPAVRHSLRSRLIERFRSRVEARVRTFTARADGVRVQGEVIDAEFRHADISSIEDQT